MSQVTIHGAEERKGTRWVQVQYCRHNHSIHPSRKSQQKVLAIFFDSSPRDAASIQATSLKLDGWLKAVAHFELLGKFKA